MRFESIKSVALSVAVAFALCSCEDFLDRPNEDSYNADNYYTTDDQCIAGVNYLYNSPWYDFQRGFIKVGEVFSGNIYWGSSPYLDFSVNGTDEDLVNMSYSLWAVIGHSSTVYDYLAKAEGPSQSVIDQCMGECLAWKAMAYFYLVRSFGDVPIVHNNSEMLESETYNDVYKVEKADVYDYILMTLEKAMELLPKSSSAGRIDYYCAEALMAKVYLTMAGVSGSLDNSYLQKAVTYAKDVIENSGRELMDSYSDVFRLANNKCDESLIAWRWTATGSVWTAQNTLQSDLAIEGFDEFGDCWGGWLGPSVDLQEAFGVKLLDNQPDSWINNVDTRCKATMMLPGYTYEYFWQDQGGFDYLAFIFDEDYNSAATNTLQTPTGANCVKHLYGNNNDHVLGSGTSAAYMYSSLATHILRLSDVYLVLAEAQCLIDGGTTTNADALDAFYAVRHRAIASYNYPTSITWDDIWKERRLEFACEGDRWYDYVRVSYYDAQFCIDELTSQKRNSIYNLGDVYETYFKNGEWTIDASTQMYDSTTSAPNVTEESFTMPMSTEDVVFNANLGSSVAPIHVDVRSTYSY